MAKDVSKQTNATSFATQIKSYFQLIKFTLTFMVTFSSVVSFLIAPYELNYTRSTISLVLLLFAAGICVTGSANALNQVFEKHTDAVMRRTASRPIASGKLSEKQGIIFAIVLGVIGIGLMYYFFNTKAAALSLLSLFLYAFIYTPLKRVNNIAVLVGAIPGAMPCLIGWVAGANAFSSGGWVLFAIQFFWQFPHFWAIAWLVDDDYAKAGFKLLPSNAGTTRATAVKVMLYSALLIPIGFLPYFTHLSGKISLIVIAVCNLGMLALSYRLYVKMDKASARGVMFASYFYLMIVLLSILADSY